MRKSCTGDEIGGEGNQHKVRVHDVCSCHATVMLCLTYLGLVVAVDVTTLWPQASALFALHIPKHHHNKQTVQTAQTTQTPLT
jgi:hypothetical protein